jgi:hypothetical protein
MRMNQVARADNVRHLPSTLGTTSYLKRLKLFNNPGGGFEGPGLKTYDRASCHSHIFTEFGGGFLEQFLQ